jgi:glycosyltransferase involved in cell wall biosynthesis
MTQKIKKKTDNAVVINADISSAQWLSLVENAIKNRADIHITDTDEDALQRVIYELSQRGYRCIGSIDGGRIYRFTPLHNDKLHILVTATNDNFHFLKPVLGLMREQGHFVSELSSAEMTTGSLLGMLKHCDLAWFEWGDGAIIPATKMPKYCRIVCRIHRYELYDTAFLQANWENVDEVIVVSQAMEKRFLQQLGDKRPAKLKVTVLPNLTEHFPLKISNDSRRNPFHLACVARFAPQKNLMLLLPIMQALMKIDQRYTLYIAGRVEDECLYESFRELIKVYGLSDNVVIEGVLPATRMSSWYRSKSFILSVSYNESQGMGIFEAMLAGLKPVAFYAAGGLSEYLPGEALFTSIEGAVASIVEGNRTPQTWIQQAVDALQQDVQRPRYSAIWQTTNTCSDLFSIIIPCYNREKYILPAIYSALNQRDANFEIVVVDDGSSDNTLAQLANIDDPRLKIVEKAHTNAPDTRNRGITESKGNYIVWLDSDDLLHPNTLGHYRDILAFWPQTDVISCAIETHGDNKKYYGSRNHPPAIWLHEIVQGNPFSNPGCCVRKAAYSKFGHYDIDFLRAHDYEFWTRLVGEGMVAFTAQCNITYRLHEGNLTGIGKVVDNIYEYRIFNNLVKRFRPDQLFPKLPQKRINDYVQQQLQTLQARCELDNLVIVIDAIDLSVDALLTAITQLGEQEDKQFQLVIVSEKALPLASISVVISDTFCPSKLHDYARTAFNGKFVRLFQWQTNGQAVSPLAVAALKNSLLEGSTPSAPFLAL